MAAVYDGTAGRSSKVTWSLWWPECGMMPWRHLGTVGLGELHAGAKTRGRNCETQLRGIGCLQNEGRNGGGASVGFVCLSANRTRYTDDTLSSHSFVFLTALRRALRCDRCRALTT